ncbi:Phosphotransferase enzyme [Myotisia sp. PD_48]|nr:Phosphotransferase enzyme [Myotisia sp. PD_48]
MLSLGVTFGRSTSRLSTIAPVKSLLRPVHVRKFTAGHAARIALGSNSNQDFYSYTSGRFLYNEDIRLRERHVEFNVAALKEVVSRHTGGGRVMNFRKLSEGGFNRVFLVTLENDLRVVVKIPYHIYVPKKYATASEVATLSFLRSKGVPVPQIYGWSATSDNPIGVEYIVMSLASGICLDTKWFDMTKKQQLTVATGIVDIEKILFNIPFGAIGSLYFKKDIPPELRADLYAPGTKDPAGDSDVFCIGPITDYMFWYGKRAEFWSDNGPWKYPRQYLEAIGKRELEWTRKYGKPLGREFPYNMLITGITPPEKYSDLLNKYMALVPYLLPQNPTDPDNQPTIRHPDLTPGNVFFSAENFEISCIIDWQHAVITPLLLAAGHPKMFENPDVEPPPTLEAPKPPDSYDTLDAETKREVDELLRLRHLFYLYRVFNGARNKKHLSAFRDPILLPRQHLIDYAGRQWTGNHITLLGALKRMCEYWSYLQTTGVECPISFTDTGLKKHAADEEASFGVTALVNSWRDELGGLSEEGWVRSEMYEHAKTKNQELKERFLIDADPDEVEQVIQTWPFRDKEEFF